MAKLKDIVDNINSGNLESALNFCALCENNENKHIIENFRGVIHLLKGQIDLAEKNFKESIKLNNKFDDPIKNLYVINLKKKNYKELLFYAKKLFQLNSYNQLYNYQLGYAFELNNDSDEAIEYYKKCIDLNGEDKKKALNNIGSIYLKKNKPKISLNYFLKANDLDENDKIIINNILICYIKLRDEKNSDLYFDKAKNLDKDYIEFLFNKAEYLILKNDLKEAIKILDQNKNNSKFLITLLKLYFNLGQNNDGNKLLSESKNRIKNNPEFFNYYGLRSLYEGNFDDGWKYYEYRNSKLVDFFKETKEWDGEKIDNNSIVVFNEQGLGDSIQFSKYLIPLTKIAKKVTFIVQSNIQNLFKKQIENLSIETIETIKDEKYDFKIALGSLIKFFYKEKFKTNENLIQSDKDKDTKWKNKVSGSKLNVGLAWSGSFNGPNEPYRSIPLNSLKKILSLNANFYCLQNEIWDRDFDYFKSSNLIDCGKYKLDEIASIIQNLDLVITTDTSLLHLSATLNKETWGMLSIYPDWRWGEFNKINPYSTLKIFKQKIFNNWDSLENKVYSELEKKINIIN
tara:strand:+ start:317 stop:2029 length:1713 start_codon:yes stop_codon:yes gene_type:complete